MALIALAFGGLAAWGAPTGYLRNFSGWEDQHIGYPARPSGKEGIIRTFGQPCSADAHLNTYVFIASDNKQAYPVHYHRLLGGAASSNLDNDIPGHIEDQKLSKELLSGIWGYNCRLKRNSSDYSTHAWGIAVDINSAYETVGHGCKTVSYPMGKIWTGHRWWWGRAWNDCMHFQYASDY